MQKKITKEKIEEKYGTNVEKIILPWSPIIYKPYLKVPFVKGTPKWNGNNVWHPLKKYAVPLHDKDMSLRVVSNDHDPNKECEYLMCSILVRRMKQGLRTMPKVDKALEIRLVKPKEVGVTKRKLVILSLYGKLTNKGSRQFYRILEGSEYLIYQGKNLSGTGIHWVDWLVFLLPINKNIVVEWVWNGVNRLVSKRLIVL